LQVQLRDIQEWNACNRTIEHMIIQWNAWVHDQLHCWKIYCTISWALARCCRMIVQHSLVVVQHSLIDARHKTNSLHLQSALHNSRFLVLCIMHVLHEHFFWWQFLRLKN